MPPIKMLDELRGRLMETIWVRKVTAERWTHPLTPKVCYRLRKLEEKARYALVRQVWQYEFEVEYHDTKVVVNLDEKLCSCGYWQKKELPCVHSLACLNFIRVEHKDKYCDKYFHTVTWRKCYAGVIHPIPSQNLYESIEATKVEERGWPS